MNKAKLLREVSWLTAPKIDRNSRKAIPDELFDAAKESLEENFLQRYFCKKYSMPPTDERLGLYTIEEMLIEYVADAIEDDRIPIGADGRPIRKVMYKGTEIIESGSPLFDAYEREWAEQNLEDEVPDDVDFIQLAEEQVGKNG